jgi:hypothetical protein
MQKYTPIVKAAHAFREISHDFTTPEEIFRESIANSLDAYAKRIWLRVAVESRRGRETVVIDLSDDGIGMNESTVRSFFNLSDSIKPGYPSVGETPRRMTGYKGHGTKIYFNSEQLELLTFDGDSQPIYCKVDDPKGELAENRVPAAEIEVVSVETLVTKRRDWKVPELADRPGTSIRVLGYHQNNKTGLEHARLKDYILWFTRWGSWEGKLCAIANISRPEVDDLRGCKLYLHGLGREADDPQIFDDDRGEEIPFGHVFPAADCTDIRKLRSKDDVDPLEILCPYLGIPRSTARLAS